MNITVMHDRTVVIDDNINIYFVLFIKFLNQFAV